MSYGSYPYFRPGYYPPTADNSQYGQPYQAPNQMLQNMQPLIQSNGGLIFVDNEEQAKNYLVAPNNVVPMFNKSKSEMYIKSADGAGMPTFKKYKLVDIEESSKNEGEGHKCNCSGRFVDKDEFESFKEKFYELQKKYDSVIKDETPKTKTTKNKDGE